jgi:outer membrane protein OmpA-like peptidoglycan-associated protein/opacity protein-like surface antigen
MIRKAFSTAALTLLLLSFAPAVFAQARDNSWEVGYFGGTNFYANELKIENAFTYGLRVGYNITPGLEIEVTYATSDWANFQQPTSTLIAENPVNFAFTTDFSAKVTSYNLRAIGNFSNSWRRWKPFLFAGAGNHKIDLSESWIPTRVDGGATFNLGTGIRFFFTDNLAARMEGSIEYEVNDIYWNKVLTAGIVGLFGGAAPSDKDMDGISDVHDKCIDTPKGAIVDRYGCPHDQDRDGIFDGIDQCPDTPEKWPVDEKGCPTDTDGDGVPDGAEKCQETPKGAKVDPTGCPLDSDGDLVFDGLDDCADTPFGAKVDPKGCPLDEDADGVADGIDQCAKSPKGAVVDKQGCPLDSDGDKVFDGLDECPDTPGWWTLDDKGCPTPRLDRLALVILERVTFKSGSAVLEPEASRSLDQAAEALMYWSDVKVEVGGYTDNRGSDALNKALSLDRAKSVRTYFVNKGIDASRIEVKGYGSANPVADNNTPAGQAQNRRVEVKKLGGDEKIRSPLSSHAPPPGAATPPEKPAEQAPPKP